MKAIRARVTDYKSIDDSGWVNLSDITCLVGKNESGKTTFVKALEKINPVNEAEKDFNVLLDYPRKGYAKYKRIHETQPAKVVEIEFELDSEELKRLEVEFGAGVMASKIVTASKNYNNIRSWGYKASDESVVKFEISQGGIPNDEISLVPKVKTITALIEGLSALPERTPAIETFLARLKKKYPKGLGDTLINSHLVNFIPKFFYFDDYSTMKGRISIQYLKRLQANNTLSNADRTFLALLSLVGASLDDFNVSANYEHLKAELEAASIKITDEVFEFWSQNSQLEVEFDISQANPEDPPPLDSGTILHVRIKNNRHRVTVSFDERSKGFVWFFSFLAYFSQLEDERDLILLLDEPGLSLHAKAQGDFLRFIEERLATKHQVIYTTHSPFMIDPHRLDRVRTVQDVESRGTVISGEVLRNDKDTLYPLQAALGYDLAQTLFIGPNCLLVEGPSDIIYLQLLSDALSDAGRTSLDPRWVIVPVGGADRISSFVTLIGANKLNVAVLIDISAKDKQRIDTLLAHALLEERKLLNVGLFTGAKEADIEDFFEPKFYLELVNGAFENDLKTKLKESDLPSGNPRIVKRIEQYFKANGICGGKFNHYKPAAYFLRNAAKLMKKLGSQTLERAENANIKLNELIER